MKKSRTQRKENSQIFYEFFHITNIIYVSVCVYISWLNSAVLTGLQLKIGQSVGL